MSDAQRIIEFVFETMNHGTACRTTALDPPEALIFVEVQSDFSNARKRESQIKRWSRAKKRALISRDYGLLQRLSRSRD
jgi:predicted GIY-YIG superfamily endonuclease